MSEDPNSQRIAIEQRINELDKNSRTLEIYLNEIIGREVKVTKLIEEDSIA